MFRWLRLHPLAVAITSTLAALACSTPEHALAQGHPREALLQAYGEDVYASTVVSYCRAQRAPNAARVQAAYQAWRARYRLENLASRLGLSASQRAAVAKAMRREVLEEMREEGSDVREGCSELAAELRELNPYEPELIDGVVAYENPLEEEQAASAEHAEAPRTQTPEPAAPKDDDSGGASYESCHCSGSSCPAIGEWTPASFVAGCSISCTRPKRPSCICGTCGGGASLCNCR